MKKSIRWLCVLLTVCLVLVACGAEVPARERLEALLGPLGNVPSGGIYATAPLEGEDLLSDRLIRALYMRSDGYLEYEGRVSEAAVYLGSAADPFFEVGVLFCYGSADTRAIVEMCMRRARLVASVHAVREGDIAIAASGRTVVYIITRDTATAQEAIDKLF